MARKWTTDGPSQLDPHWPGPSCWCDPEFVRSAKHPGGWKLVHRAHEERVTKLDLETLGRKSIGMHGRNSIRASALIKLDNTKKRLESLRIVRKNGNSQQAG